MEITLEKIELVKDRTGVTYREAKEALEAVEGSVVDAIISIEDSAGERKKSGSREDGGFYGHKVIDKIKELIKKGNVSKIVVKKEEEILLNLPVNAGIIGTLIAPFAMIVGLITAFGTKCVIEVVKEDGSVIDVSEMANETFEDVVEKGAVIADEVITKGTDVYNSVVSKTTDALSKVKKEKESVADGGEVEKSKDSGEKKKGGDEE